MMSVVVRILCGLLFGITEAGVLRWLLFSNSRINAVSREQDSGDVTEDEEETDDQQGEALEVNGAALFHGIKRKKALLAVCSVLAFLIGCRLGSAVSVFSLIKVLAAMVGISACMLVDLYTLQIPNKYVLMMGAFRLVLLPFELFAAGAAWRSVLVNSVMGLTVAFIVLFLMSIISRQGIGMGDVKLLSMTGFLCGIYLVVNTLVYGLVLCAVISLIMVGTGKLSMKMKVPFGPFIYMGFVLAVLLGAF